MVFLHGLVEFLFCLILFIASLQSRLYIEYPLSRTLHCTRLALMEEISLVGAKEIHFGVGWEIAGSEDGRVVVFNSVSGEKMKYGHHYKSQKIRRGSQKLLFWTRSTVTKKMS